MKLTIKKWLAIALCMVMTISLLAACGSNTPAGASGAAATTAAPAATTAAEKVTIKVTHWGDTSTQEKDPDYQLVQKWNSAHQDIEVKLDIIPGDGYSTKLTTSFASGDGYDVFLSGEGDFYKWFSQGVNQPLDQFISADTSFKPDSFSKAVYNMGNVDGKQYYLIKDYNPLVLYYNKKMFDEAKLTYPDDTTTWDTIFADAVKLTKKDGSGKYRAYGFNAGAWTYMLYTYLLSNGTDIADPTGLKVDGFMNSPATVKALEKWFNLAKAGPGKSSPTSANLDSFGGQEKMLANNMLAMFISGYWSAPGLQQNNASYGTALIPKDNSGNRASILCAAGYCMSNATKNSDAAWQVLKMLTDIEAQKVRTSSATGVLPTSNDLLETAKTTIPQQDLAVVNILPFCKQPMGERSKLGSTIDSEFNNAMQQIVQGSGGSVQDIMNNAVKAVQSKAQ